jgi:hypothetical protein
MRLCASRRPIGQRSVPLACALTSASSSIGWRTCQTRCVGSRRLPRRVAAARIGVISDSCVCANGSSTPHPPLVICGVWRTSSSARVSSHFRLGSNRRLRTRHPSSPLHPLPRSTSFAAIRSCFAGKGSCGPLRSFSPRRPIVTPINQRLACSPHEPGSPRENLPMRDISLGRSLMTRRSSTPRGSLHARSSKRAHWMKA